MNERDYVTSAPSPGASTTGGGNTIAMFLSLFLLVLAFFIILVSISTIADVKSQAVRNSLSSTFRTVLSPSTDPTEFTSMDGDILAGQQFQETVTGLFSTSLQVAKVEIVRPGKLMRIKLPVSAMFADGATEVRPVAVPVLDRVVAVLSSRPPGLRFDMEFVIGTAFTEGTSLPVNQTLETGRAGNLAREMARRGVPPDSVAIGIRPGRTDQIIIWFFVRDEAETLLRLQPKKVPDGPS
ncbi:MAG: hypothetical protein HOH04_17500 [Rhodospirillaceae bacterium]|nr:hypothetical protein [Rhodospirillaceae bacterium]